MMSTAYKYGPNTIIIGTSASTGKSDDLQPVQKEKQTMPAQATKALAQGRHCSGCHVKMGTHEECVEIEDKGVFHPRCNPDRTPPAKLNCRVKLPETMALPYQV
jgi:hypothetical protein